MIEFLFQFHWETIRSPMIIRWRYHVTHLQYTGVVVYFYCFRFGVKIESYRKGESKDKNFYSRII